jgi:hypothetical protein
MANKVGVKGLIEVVTDAAVAGSAYYFFGWIGVAIWTLFVIGMFCTQMISNQRLILDTMLERLPVRCAFCHREIVDQGGILDGKLVYHEACIDKLESHRGAA